ncbi:hypothetical protein BpHYR1_025285 [Brachionus plicatilis]|uniref:Uncharacterized protein n=1 Tax=Brachionus plicatilis TaxID=10195 RepID=A0A3M7R423_BRAPC|nr:hypothetical protein BpHYR1_025285 [Brachionus plicatilis]
MADPNSTDLSEFGKILRFESISDRLSDLNEKYINKILNYSLPLIARLVDGYNRGFTSRFVMDFNQDLWKIMHEIIFGKFYKTMNLSKI